MAKRRDSLESVSASRTGKEQHGAFCNGNGVPRPTLTVETNDKGQIKSHIRQMWLVETPEERVRQAYVVTLHNEYGFNLDQMDEEVCGTFGGRINNFGRQ